MKKRFGALGAFALTVATALSLTACGGHIGEPAEITPSEAFNQKGLWFVVYDDDPVGKDSVIVEVWDFDGNGNVTVMPTPVLTSSIETLGNLKDLSDEEILDKVKQDILDEQQMKKINCQDLVKAINESRVQGQENRAKEKKSGVRNRWRDPIYTDVGPLTMTNFELYDTLHLSPVKFDLHVETNQSGNEAELEMINASYSYPAWPFSQSGPGYPEFDENKNRMTSGEIILKQDTVGVPMREPASAVVYDKKYVGYSDGDGYYFLKVAKNPESKTIYKLDTPGTKGITVD